MKKLIAVAIIASVLVMALGVIAFAVIVRQNDHGREFAIAANEVDNLIREGDNENASKKAQELRTDIVNKERAKTDYLVLVVTGVCVLIILGGSTYLAIRIIRPFEKLKDFADKVSVGQLDVPLEYEKGDYFGKFTFAFDSMRNEIKRAREGEQEAIENNKTVIATLSHDIKTPISSIRAYAEALEMGMGDDPEARDKFVKTIMDKCDEVSGLSEDLLMHSLTDMDKLKMYPMKFELAGFLEKTLGELDAEGGRIHFSRPSYEMFVNMDIARLSQVVENIISNSNKYAGTPIDVTLTHEDNMAAVIFKDQGPGIADEDLPFVFEKFYRGKNAGDKEGSGLGLYTVKYIIEKSGGKVSLRNDNGLEVKILLRIS